MKILQILVLDKNMVKDENNQNINDNSHDRIIRIQVMSWKKVQLVQLVVLVFHDSNYSLLKKVKKESIKTVCIENL